MTDIGTLVAGKYRLLRLLGDGGMGSVYEASHTMLGTRVAVKLLHREMLERSGLVERFLQEAQVAAQIRSPHVVHMLDVGQEPGHAPYLVMELLEGEPLSSVLERDQRVPEARAVEYTIQILTALEAAHALGVIHRDLKPENVFITVAAGRPLVKLIDFGIAKLRTTDPGAKNLTVAGTVMGTAEYMAPEQAIRADQVDGRADLYSVGVMLYEMIAGVRPIVTDDPRALFTLAERGAIRPLTEYGTTPSLWELVRRTLAFRPEERFGNATELRLALEQNRTGEAPPVARPAELSAGTLMGAPVPQALALTGQVPRKPQAAGQASSYEAPAAPRASGTQMAPPVQAPVWNPGPGQPPPQHAFQHGQPQRPPQGGPMHPGHGGPPPGYPQGPRPPQGAAIPAPPPMGRPKKKGSAGTIVAVVVLLLLLAGGATAAVLLADSGPETAQPIPTAPAATPATTPTAPGEVPAAAETAHVDQGGALGPLAPANGATTPPPTAPNGQTPQPKPSTTPPKPSAEPTILPPLFPSGLPPLPSTFPTAMPQIPGLPSAFPWLPPPAQ